MRGLYAIVDAGALALRHLDPVAFAGAVLAVAPAALQLRAKDVPARETLALLRELASMCRRAGVPIVANDRPDFAVLAGCDAVHVGQDDMPIDRVRRIAPGMRVGVSTHTLDQLDAALAARPDYVAFGPVFSTSTKTDASPVVSLSSLHAAYSRARAAGIPLVAIGGITREKASGIVGAADAVAVNADLLPPVVVLGEARATSDVLHEVTARARELHALFARAAGVAAGSATQTES
jgi:thiamine-phosphate pyrophosphorylase